MSINLVLTLSLEKDLYDSQSEHGSHPKCQIRVFSTVKKPHNQL